MRGLIFVMALLFSASAFADNWIMLKDSPNSDVHFFINIDSIKRGVNTDYHKGVTTVTGKRIKKANDKSSDVTTLYIDCSQNEFAVGDEIEYNGTSRVRERSGIFVNFGKISDTSVVHQVASYVCH